MRDQRGGRRGSKVRGSKDRQSNNCYCQRQSSPTCQLVKERGAKLALVLVKERG